MEHLKAKNIDLKNKGIPMISSPDSDAYEFDSPFLNETVFTDEAATKSAQAWESRRAKFELESPFLQAFEPGQGTITEPKDEEYEEFSEELDQAEYAEEVFAESWTGEQEQLEPEIMGERPNDLDVDRISDEKDILVKSTINTFEAIEPEFINELKEAEISESAWRMRPPSRYQANRYICWAEAFSSWSMVTKGVRKFPTGQDVINFLKPLGLVNTDDSLKLPKGMDEIQRVFGLKCRKFEQGYNLSGINWVSMLRHSHLIVIFKRPTASYFHFVVVYGVDRFHICFMDPELNPALPSLDQVKTNRVCAKLENFGARADVFWIFWKEQILAKELLEPSNIDDQNNQEFSEYLLDETEAEDVFNEEFGEVIHSSKPKNHFLDNFDVDTQPYLELTENQEAVWHESEIDLEGVDFEESEGVYLNTSSDSELPVTNQPTPGYFYEIQHGKGGLLTTAQTAYQIKTNAERLEWAQQINNHPLNRKFWRKPANSFEQKYFPKGIISFNPTFSCGKEQRLASKGEKKCFARIWIPIKERYTHPILGRAIDLPKNTLLALLQPTSNISTAELELLQHETSTTEPQKKQTFEKVTKPKVSPHRFICSIIATIPHPSNKDVAVTYGPATGVLIGFRHILTAAHVLSQKWLDGQQLKAEMVFVTPMHQSKSGLAKVYDDNESDLINALLTSHRPLGSFRASSYKIHPQYINSASSPTDSNSSLFDIALIKLNTSLGSLPWEKGQFGYWGSSRWGDRTILSSTTNRTLLEKKSICLAGYPTPRIPKHGINQWESRGAVDNANLPKYAKAVKGGWMRLGYQTQAEDGHSGSPVWVTFTSNDKTFRKLVAVHSDGGSGVEAQSGVLITPEVLDWIQKSQ